MLCTKVNSNGGLRAPNVEVLFKSLHFAWIFRFVVRDQNFLETWKSIPNYFFEKYGGFNFLLRCNYDKKFLEKSNIPHFYRQILANFLELKTSYGLQNESDVFLFNNKDILIDGHTIFYSKWFEKGIISIHDVLDHTWKFLTFHEFQKKYGVKCNFFSISVLSPRNKAVTAIIILHFTWPLQFSILFRLCSRFIWYTFNYHALCKF